MTGPTPATRRIKVCAVDGCEKPAQGRGWCNTHYGNWRKNGDPLSTLRPAVRFANATVEGPVPDAAPELGPCLLYTGGTNSNGYGQFRYNGRGGYAHRYAWESVRGPIPRGLQIDHLCRVRTCVRLEHLEVVSPAVNTVRALTARAECRQGHPLTPDNIVPGTRARCLICKREQQTRSWARRARLANGKPDRRLRFDQKTVREQIAEVRANRSTIAEAARVIGCNPNYLGRRIWHETKADVRARDTACVRCGQTGHLDVQHRRARGSGGSANPETSFGMVNLIGLCRPCHDYVETHRRWARAMGYAVSHWQDPAMVPVRHWLHGLAFLTPDGWAPIPKGPNGAVLVAEHAERVARSRGYESDDVVHISTALRELTAEWTGVPA